MALGDLLDAGALLNVVLLVLAIVGWVRFRGTLRWMAIVAVAATGLDLLFDLVAPIGEGGAHLLVVSAVIIMFLIALFRRD